MSGSFPSLAMLGGLEVLVVMAAAFLGAVIVTLVLVLLVRAVADGRSARRRLSELEKQVQELRARVQGGAVPPPRSSS